MSGQASKLSADDVLQHFPVEGQIGHDLLQPAVLVFKRLKTAHLIRQQATIPLLPVEVGGLAIPGLAADLRIRCAFLVLLQDESLPSSLSLLNFPHFVDLLLTRAGGMQIPHKISLAGHCYC